MITKIHTIFNMNLIKTLEEIELIRESAQLVSKTLGMLASEIKPGINTLYLDNLAESFIRDHNGVPGFLGLYDFPNTLCISPNSQVVHGIPNKEIIKEGEILSIDCGVLKNGYYGDHAFTFTVGEVDKEILELLETTKQSLYVGIEQFKAGNRVGDVGYAIQNYNESKGYGVVRELVGHGLGKEMHEKPEMPNYGKRGSGKKFKEGMVVAIEPMINMGTPNYLISAALTLIMAQRLARKTCLDCRVIDENITPKLLNSIGFLPEQSARAKIYKGTGCDGCSGSGYKGRMGIYEILEIENELKAGILSNLQQTELNAIAKKNGFRTMQDMGQDLLLSSDLSFAEYERVLQSN